MGFGRRVIIETSVSPRFGGCYGNDEGCFFLVFKTRK